MIVLAAIAVATLLVAAFPEGAAAQACTKSWDGDALTLNWHDGTNWNPDGVPGSADEVCIDVAGELNVTFSQWTHTINSLTSPESLRVTAGTLTVNSTSSLAKLTLSPNPPKEGVGLAS